MPTFTLKPLGPFALEELAMFGFGQRSEQKWDGLMRLAFCLDDFTGQVGVEVRQDDGGVHGRFEGVEARLSWSGARSPEFCR